jgi:hypothetical protein
MKTSIILLTIAFTGAIVVHFTFGLPLGVAFLLFFVGWPVGGTLITIDDDLPGGWSNPDGTVRPPWLEAPFWRQVSWGLAVSAAGFAFDFGWRTSAGLWAWLAGVGFAVLALVLRKTSIHMYTVLVNFADHRIGIEQYQAESPHAALSRFLSSAESVQECSAIQRAWLLEEALGPKLIHVAGGHRGLWIWDKAVPDDCEHLEVLGGHVIQTDPRGPRRR